MTSALAGQAYSSAVQAASALHSMAMLQVFQAKLMESWMGLDLTLQPSRNCTVTPQDIGRLMASIVVLECQLWLNLTEIKEAVKVPFLDSPVSPTGLFGSAVEGFAEHFTAAQKLPQVMRHFLPKRSSSVIATSCPRPAPAQQPAKPAPPSTQSHRSLSPDSADVGSCTSGVILIS